MLYFDNSQLIEVISHYPTNLKGFSTTCSKLLVLVSSWLYEIIIDHNTIDCNFNFLFGSRICEKFMNSPAISYNSVLQMVDSESL